jgi:hypothetical protein
MMDTSVRLGRWPIARLFGRNPLVRTSDRVQALVLVLAVVMPLLSVPIAAAVGTAVHDSNRQIYAEQARTRHSVTATVTDHDAAQQVLLTETTTVAAQWSAAGAEHTGTVEAASTAKSGDLVEIWVDENGAQVGKPAPTTRAAVEAVMAALAIWFCVVAAAVTLCVGTRTVCTRIRFTEWQHDLDNLVDHGDGYTTSQP